MGCAASAVKITECNATQNETQADVIRLYYFPVYGRASPLKFMLSYANVPHENVDISFPKFFVGGVKKRFGSMPVIERSDGTFMKETPPMARYIARHNGLYPEDPIEAWRNDWIVEKFQPVINYFSAHCLAFGKAKEAGIVKAYEIGDAFFPQIEEFCKDGWLIGDGSKIYMCDFFVGSFYTDSFSNPKSWVPKERKDGYAQKFPNFFAYGARFEAANQEWMKNRK